METKLAYVASMVCVFGLLFDKCFSALDKSSETYNTSRGAARGDLVLHNAMSSGKPRHTTTSLPHDTGNIHAHTNDSQVEKSQTNRNKISAGQLHNANYLQSNKTRKVRNFSFYGYETLSEAENIPSINTTEPSAPLSEHGRPTSKHSISARQLLNISHYTSSPVSVANPDIDASYINNKGVIHPKNISTRAPGGSTPIDRLKGDKSKRESFVLSSPKGKHKSFLRSSEDLKFPRSAPLRKEADKPASESQDSFLLHIPDPATRPGDNSSSVGSYGLDEGSFLLDSPILDHQQGFLPSNPPDHKMFLKDYAKGNSNPKSPSLVDNPALAHSNPDSAPVRKSSWLNPDIFDDPRKNKQKLHIGGLFELSGTYGESELESAQMAIRHINRQDFVPGYELVLLANDTKCDPGCGADAFYDFMYCKPQLIMLIGTGCSEVAKTLGEIVHYWNLLFVSYAATSPALSEREKYPTFYRLAPADSSYNEARKTFIQHFNWNTVVALNEEIETFTLAMNDMYQTFDRENITVKVSLTFRSTGDDLRDKLQELKAYHLGMYGQRYVWMLLGSYMTRWWTRHTETTNCTHAQLAEAVKGYFSVTSVNSIIGNERSISGYTSADFLEEYQSLGLGTPRSAFAQLTYDSVWTVALTLRKAQEKWLRSPASPHTLEDFKYDGGESMRGDFFDIMGGLDFVGVSGPVSFDGSDREGVTVLEQHQGGYQVKIGLFNPENNTLDMKCKGCMPVVWQDDHVPADKFTIVVRLELIQKEAFYTISAVAGFGIYLAIVFLSFNLHNRKLRYIKLSSPKLNNVAVIGCVMVYLAVIMLGLDDSVMVDNAFSYICTVRAFLLAAGFSLAFGAMFTKTYRVHQIFRGCHSGLVKSKLLKDKQLLFIIVALLVLDAIVISLWVVIDPMYRTVTNFTLEPSSELKDILIIPQLSKCYSHHMVKWTGTLYAYKGLLLLFGVYMAWETRHVKIPALNDSQYIGMNIYNVVLSSITGVALSNVISDRPTLSYCLVAALIILSTTVMLCLLFLPKMYAIIKHNGAPVVATAGLTVEANTRRFVVDEKRELHYRAEVQNRVYKRELHELDQEITRLQRKIDVCNTPQPAEFLSLTEDQKSEVSLEASRTSQAVHRSESVTDVDDITSLPELQPVSFGPKTKLEKQDSGFHTLSFKNQNFKTTDIEGKFKFPARSRTKTNQMCIQNTNYVNIEHEHANPSSNHSSPGGFTSGSRNPSESHSSSNIRRQDSQEGEAEEKTSLLSRKESDPPPYSLLFASGGIDNTRTPMDTYFKTNPHTEHDMDTFTEEDEQDAKRNINIHGPLQDKCKLQHSQPVTPELECQEGGDLAPVAGGTQPKHHRLAKQRADVLRKELSKIQQELKSLGEVEMEVSYV